MTGSVPDFGQSKELHEYGMKNGAPPIAHKTALIDFDGTIRKWGPLMGWMDPEPDAINTLLELQERGYNIIIFTSRMSRVWARSVVGDSIKDQNDFLEGQYNFVRDYMLGYGILVQGITAEKQPAEFYVDDKAIGYRGSWREVLNDSLVTGVKA